MWINLYKALCEHSTRKKPKPLYMYREIQHSYTEIETLEDK